MLDAERLGELEKGDDRRIAAPVLQPAQILLCEAGRLGEPLLGQALIQPYPFYVATNEPPHVHAGKLDDYPHPDHFGGIGVFSPEGSQIPVYGSAQTRASIEADRWGLVKASHDLGSQETMSGVGRSVASRRAG